MHLGEGHNELELCSMEPHPPASQGHSIPPSPAAECWAGNTPGEVLAAGQETEGALGTWGYLGGSKG